MNICEKSLNKWIPATSGHSDRSSLLRNHSQICIDRREDRVLSLLLSLDPVVPETCDISANYKSEM